jgi:hypothetical protein
MQNMLRAGALCFVAMAVWLFASPALSHELHLPARGRIGPLALFAFAPLGDQPNTCSTDTPAGPFPVVPVGYQPKFNTIAHRFLDDEQGAAQVTPQMYYVLDNIITEAKARISTLPPPASPSDGAYAKSVLKAVDCVLLRHGFVYPGRGLVQLLSDGLGPTLYDVPSELTLLQDGQGHNGRRAKFISGPGPYYVVDCDIASFIYLAVADEMHFPIHLIDIPAHNFVRWDFPNGSFIDFETMDGMVTNDAYYASGWGIPPAFVHKGGVLVSMTEQQALAYHYALVAGAWSWAGNTDMMVEFLSRAIQTDPTRAFSYNNLAWFYAAVPNRPLRNGSLAVQDGTKGAGIFPDGDDLDTLACGFAQAGDFTSAINTEDRASNSGYVPFSSDIKNDQNLFRQKQTCNDPGFGADPLPFRPHTPWPGQVSERMFLRLH